MATASQKMTLIRFLDLILGALMAHPSMLDPVVKMPLLTAIPCCTEDGDADGEKYSQVAPPVWRYVSEDIAP